MTECARWGLWRLRKMRDLGVNLQTEHGIANCSQTVSGEFKQGVWWTYRSDSIFCQITLDFVLLQHHKDKSLSKVTLARYRHAVWRK